MGTSERKKIIAPEKVVNIGNATKLVIVCESCGSMVGQDSGSLIDKFRIDLATLFHIGHTLVTWSKEKNQVLSGVRCDLRDFT